MVFAGAFPSAPSLKLYWGFVTSQKGKKAPERGQMLFMGMMMMCNMVLIRGKFD